MKFWIVTEKLLFLGNHYKHPPDMAQIIPAIIDVSNKIIRLRGELVLLDRDVAEIYGTETKFINQAVKNNPDKFPKGYVYSLDKQEFADLKSKILTSSSPYSTSHGGSRKLPSVFTEKGLYMLATILKGKKAVAATLQIIETYAKVREMQRDMLEIHDTANPETKKSKTMRVGETLTEILMPDLRTYETESTLEINLFVGKIKHVIKRKRVVDAEQDEIEEVEEMEMPYGKADNIQSKTNPIETHS